MNTLEKKLAELDEFSEFIKNREYATGRKLTYDERIEISRWWFSDTTHNQPTKAHAGPTARQLLDARRGYKS